MCSAFSSYNADFTLGTLPVKETDHCTELQTTQSFIPSFYKKLEARQLLALISTGHGCQGLGVRPPWLDLHDVATVKKDATAPILTLGFEARTTRKGKRTKTELAEGSPILGSFHRSSTQ